MEFWGLLVFLAIITFGWLWRRHERKIFDHIRRAYSVGRRQGHHEGWLAHANRRPLESMPPRLQEIEEATGTRQGWGDGFYDYPDTDELVQSGMLGNVTWEEWQAKKLGELNQQHLGSSE
jgi:hypothetical protein